ncbi:MAG: iron transporter [Clostridia bacterium]|jgi:major membrane immunogen (membrane-anchored lipoprotein)|nr:iron transporter [Clostridia bacterium]
MKTNFNKAFSYFLCIAVLCLLLAACGQKPDGKAPLEDGVYSADFKTDGSMFHVNEAHHGKGTLTVKDGKMTIHITMPSKNTVNLFAGKAEDAKKEGAALIEPTLDTVTYDDGSTEEVYGFDIPVPYLDKEFDCALVGTKGKWYDHKVSVSNPEPVGASVEDGEYSCGVTLTGGSGKASVESPAKIVVKDGKMTATVVWSSSHYEYMTLGETKYEPVNAEGNSTFEIPVELDKDIAVSALTTAMSEPHLIDYTLRFDSASLKKAN